MPHDLIWDVQTQLDRKERRVCSRSEPPQLKEICNPANVSSCSIGSFVDDRVDVCRERFDETSLSRFARDFDRAKPESNRTKVVVKLNKGAERGQKAGHTAE
jgi:hypothetical protein